MFDHQSRCRNNGGEHTRRFPRSRAADTRRQGHDGLSEFRARFLIGSPPRLRADGHVQKKLQLQITAAAEASAGLEVHSQQPEEVCRALRPPGPLGPTTTHTQRTETRTNSPAFRPLLLAERSFHQELLVGCYSLNKHEEPRVEWPCVSRRFAMTLCARSLVG